jgi:hypothetical protein
MRRVNWFSAILAIGAVACAESTAPRPTPPLDEADFFSHLQFLADDSLYGRGAGTPAEQRAAEYVRDEFVRYGLAAGVPGFLQPFSIGAGGQSPDAGSASQNVIGIVLGSGRLAGQWVVVGAHYDHIGWRRVTPDSIVIFNGADDNASGTALLLELARFVAEYFTVGEGAGSARRSLMFHAYGAEEIGLVGSRHFCAAPTVPLDSVAVMVNLDMVGRLRDNQLILSGASSAPFLPALLAEENTAGLDLVLDDRHVGASDHKCYYDAGRPVVHFFTGLHPDYHSPRDDPELVNGAGAITVGNLALRVLLRATVQATLN